MILSPESYCQPSLLWPSPAAQTCAVLLAIPTVDRPLPDQSVPASNPFTSLMSYFAKAPLIIVRFTRFPLAS